MKINSVFFLTLSTIIAVTLASYSEKYSEEYNWYSACYGGLATQVLYCEAQFGGGDGPDEGPGDCSCTSTPAMGAMLFCVYSHDVNINKMNNFIIDSCAAENVTFTDEDLEEIYRNATHYLVDITTVENYNISQDIFESPIYFDPDYVHRNYLSNVVVNNNTYWGWVYGIASIAYWAGVLTLCGIFHWSRILFPNFVAKCTGPITRAWRSTVIIPATFNKNHLESKHLFGKIDIGLIPTRLETLVIIGFFALELAINIAHIDLVPGGNTFYERRSTETHELVGIRTGILAVWIFPLVMLFAGRNNVLITLTGINQATFNAYHRWTARAFTILAFIHGWSFMDDVIIYKSANTDIKQEYLYWGMISIAFAIALCFQAIWYFRKHFYNLFALVHFIFAVFCLFGLWLHCWKLRSYHEWQFCAGAIWCFDRLIRIVRCSAFGFPKVNCRVIGDDTIKIVVPKPKYWKAFPGAFCYIYFFRPARWWESHPFTIVESDGDEQHIVFYIKVKDGVTLYIYNYLMKQPDHAADIRVTVEGPYGHQQPTRKYTKSLLIASGSGISGPYAHALDLVSRASDKQVSLYWIIKEWKNLEWFYEELVKLGHYKDKCQVHIYCTRGGDMPNFPPSECSSKLRLMTKNINEKEDIPMDVQAKLSNIQALSYINFANGRPDINRILEEEIDSVPGSVAVMTCGHPKMSDDIRSYVAGMVMKSDKRIDYFEENQVW